jgi:hypothetical protein
VPLAVRLVLALAAILAAGAGALVLFPTRRTPRDSDHEDEAARRQRVAAEHDTAAGERLQTALDACKGLPTRLAALADAADAKAAALRDAKDAGLVIAPHHISPDWRAPWELHRDSPRLPVTAWQLLDRAFDQLTATLDDSDTDDPEPSARAYQQLAHAARQVATQLTNDDARELSSELARCAFCGKLARDVKKIITGPTSAICDECVDLSTWLLDDELGDSWRGPRPD